jgi:predicted metal-binding membrane protein
LEIVAGRARRARPCGFDVAPAATLAETRLHRGYSPEMSSHPSTFARRSFRQGVVAALVGVSLVAWALVVARMRGMDDGPGTDLGSLGWYLGIWVTMMAAMMLPSATPMVLFFSKISEQSSRRPALATSLFVVGYLIAWSAYGLVAFAIFRLVRTLDPPFLAWDRAGTEIAGAAIVLAGIYQLTPFKRTCLSKCRTPLGFVMHHWRDGVSGAVRMGVVHGGWCIGCCWALMVLLFAVGVMSITWMILVAAIVFAEKVLPVGERLAHLIAVVLIAFGVWVATAPWSVPGLTQPGGMQKMSSMLGASAGLVA